MEEYTSYEQVKQKLTELKKTNEKVSYLKNVFIKNEKFRLNFEKETLKEKTIDEVTMPTCLQSEPNILVQPELQVKAYYDSFTSIRIDDLDAEDWYDYIQEILSPLDNKNIVPIINLLLLKIQKEINYYQVEAKNDITLAPLYLEEIDKIKCLKNSLLCYREEINNIVLPSKTTHKNRIIFMSKGNKIPFLEGMYAIEDQEFLNRLYKIYLSIVDGSFAHKNFRNFRNINNKVNIGMEVKGFKVRILFDQIGPDCYVLIGSFLKKSSLDKTVVDEMSRLLNYYKISKDYILNQMKDNDFMDRQEELTKYVENYFQNKGEKEKCKSYGMNFKNI